MKIVKSFLILLSSVSAAVALAQYESAADHDYQFNREGKIAMLEINQQNISGIQFEFRYDETVQVSSVENCLAGIPETHKGSFTTCKHFPDKNTVLVVVSDIGESRSLTGPIGWIEFQGASRTSESPFRLSQIVALDTNGQTLSDSSNSISFSVE